MKRKPVNLSGVTKEQGQELLALGAGMAIRAVKDHDPSACRDLGWLAKLLKRDDALRAGRGKG